MYLMQRPKSLLSKRRCNASPKKEFLKIWFVLLFSAMNSTIPVSWLNNEIVQKYYHLTIVNVKKVISEVMGSDKTEKTMPRYNNAGNVGSQKF
jgi:hypothetical protein